MIAFIEVVVGVAVVLVAGYFIAEHRDRIRQVANAAIVGLSAGHGLSDASHDYGRPPARWALASDGPALGSFRHASGRHTFGLSFQLNWELDQP